MPRLSGMKALILGAAGGIGAATAQIFALEGARLALLDLSAGLDTVANEVAAAGDLASFATCDVTDAGSMAAAISDAADALKGLDVVFNCTGGSSPADGAVDVVDDSEFWRTISVDLFGTWLTCKYAVSHLRKSACASIINTTSSAALRGTRGANAYAAAKGGVASFTRALAIEYAPNRIRVNAIAPGATMTARIAKRMAESAELREKIRVRQPLGLVEPEEIAYLAVYLGSRESRSVTGQVISVDGGITA